MAEPCMDEETYVDKDGEECPYCRCGGELNVTTQLEVDTTTAHRDVKCGHCDVTFREYFHLAGFEPVEKDLWKD